MLVTNDAQDMRSIFHSQLELCVEQLTRAQADLERLKNSSTNNGALQQQGSQQIAEADQQQGGAAGALPKQSSKQSLLSKQPTPGRPSQQQSSQRPQPG
jgi:hypothetical protein